MTTQLQVERDLANVRITNELAQRLQSRMDKEAAVVEALQGATKEACDAMVANERLYDNQREKVAEVLADPENGHIAALNMARDLSAHRNAAEASTIGQPVGHEKTAGARTTGAPTADHDATESGQAFRRALLGNG